MSLSEDGSFTAYSKEYGEHYHSTRDGALYESLVKHVIPAFKLKRNAKELNILDICFGLGFTTLATIYYAKKENLTTKLNIYSPELDSQLIESLKDFTYPKEFLFLQELIISLIKDKVYDDGNLSIALFLGDAREYIREFKEDTFDIVYQDAFSPSTNPILWTREYFKDISRIIKEDGILTSYSMALTTRLALHENDFAIYINSGENFRDSTLACKEKLTDFKEVDMLHKIACNPNAISLRD